MKICVLGLDCAATEVIFNDERLVNIRRLMDLGLYGTLQNAVPVLSWDQLMRDGKKSIIIGVPPNFPPSIKAEIQHLVGDYPVDVTDFRTDRKEWLRDEIFAMSRKQWQVVRHLMTSHEWDYFHFVDIGLDRVHHGFWNYFDRNHAQYEAGNPYENVVPDYYLSLDEQIGSVMELLDGETILLLVSKHGAQRSDGCSNAQQGMFLLAAPNCPLTGEHTGARLLDMAPTLLDLAGYDIPESMQGRSLLAGMEKKGANQGFGDADSEQLIHDRLAGLGYI